MTAANFMKLKSTKNHFSHIIIDEAGQVYYHSYNYFNTVAGF